MQLVLMLVLYFLSMLVLGKANPVNVSVLVDSRNISEMTLGLETDDVPIGEEVTQDMDFPNVPLAQSNSRSAVVKDLQKNMDALKRRVNKMGQYGGLTLEADEFDDSPGILVNEKSSMVETTIPLTMKGATEIAGHPGVIIESHKPQGQGSGSGRDVKDEEETSKNFLMGSSSIQVILGALLMLILFMGLGFACCFFCAKQTKGYNPELPDLAIFRHFGDF
jgi:hypothetical protein